MQSILPKLKSFEVWFVVGSQALYGQKTLDQIAVNSKAIAAHLNSVLPVSVVLKPTVTSPSEIENVCVQASSSPHCVGLITWMHTFSPAKMWIAGLSRLTKPFLHLHTQFNRDIPWQNIDMDFMNLNQSAHGDREFGFIGTRLRLNRSVVVGHWQDQTVAQEIEVWCRAAVGWQAMQTAKVARFGDNMREVAVTEGDKVEAQIKLGMSVSGYGIGDLVASIARVSPSEVEQRIACYYDEYQVDAELGPKGNRRKDLEEAAKIELGIEHFLQEGGFTAFTDTFEDLTGIPQLPGHAIQRLMAAGYGFGAEGDWKTAALVYAMKVMALGLKGGTSFMEDYTYHLDPNESLVLGAHMLEICPSISEEKPRLAISPLGIGGKADPVRLIFDAKPGPAINASLIHMGDRLRLIVNPCQVQTPPAMPCLPIARALWKPEPDLKHSAAAWIYAGGAHHTGFSQALTQAHLRAFADIAGMEFVLIDHSTTDIDRFRQELKWNDVAYTLSRIRL